MGTCHVHRFDPQSGAFEMVADDFEEPNRLFRVEILKMVEQALGVKISKRTEAAKLAA